MESADVSCRLLLLRGTCSLSVGAQVLHWNRSRGPNGAGGTARYTPPLKIGAETARWKTTLPAGESSPVLWTAARDERFVLAISAPSGCAGAALWRQRCGETLAKMVTRFPYRLCRNTWKFVNQDDDFPVDQRVLQACIAPRPVYVHGGAEDTWADPRGEYLSACQASEVYRLVGRKGLASQASPAVGEAIIETDVGTTSEKEVIRSRIRTGSVSSTSRIATSRSVWNHVRNCRRLHE
jgi:hypothetical protein